MQPLNFCATGLCKESAAMFDTGLWVSSLLHLRLSENEPLEISSQVTLKSLSRFIYTKF